MARRETRTANPATEKNPEQKPVRTRRSKKKATAKKKAATRSSKVVAVTVKPSYKDLAKMELVLDKGVAAFKAGRFKSAKQALQKVSDLLDIL